MTNHASIPRNVAAAALMLAFGVVAMSCVDSDLSRDETGRIHGTGEVKYHYDDGSVQRVDAYRDDNLVTSRWYRPDGSLVAETAWENGAGEEFYLRDDGSVRRKLTMQDGVAHGEAIYYDESGEIAERAIYEDGVRVD